MTPVLHGEHQILGFQIPIDNILPAQILQSQQHLLSVEFVILPNRRVLILNLRQKGAALNVFEFEIQFVVVLE